MIYDETSLMTEVTRYTKDPHGRPVVVQVPYIQVGEDWPGAAPLDGTPEGTLWAPSDVDVPEDRRLSREEFDEESEAWREREALREAEEREARLADEERRALARVKAREELSGLGLSDETIRVLMGGAS